MRPPDGAGLAGSSEPAIRFFSGPTGHTVAYAVQGSGPPLVFSAWWVSHVEEDYKQAGFRRFFERLGAHFTVVRYDRPGSGLSDRERDRVNVHDEACTLEALCDHLELEKTSLFGLTCAAPPALMVAAKHPRRVDKLVLFGAYVKGQNVAPPPLRDAVTQLVRASWGMGARMLTDLFVPGLDGPQRAALSDNQRAAASKEMAAKLLQLTFEADVSDIAPHIEVPALVMHRKGDRSIPFAAGRELAAALPNAAFVPLEGNEHVPWAGDADAVLDAIFDFLDVGRPPDAGSETAPYALVRSGEVWALTFDHQTVHLKDALGLSDLAMLLASPDQEIPVGALWSGTENAVAVGRTHDPVLDDEALDAYKGRLRALEQELETARGRREQLLRTERDGLVKELRAAVGLGGRKRSLDLTSERVRKAVTARIRASIRKIIEVLPAAGLHLERAVTTGTHCRYKSTERVRWEVR